MTRHSTGQPPLWATEPGALERVTYLWELATVNDRGIHTTFADGALKVPAHGFTTEELVEATSSVSLQTVAGVLGGLGNALSAEKLPVYEYAVGKTWHFVWDWGEKSGLFLMAPGMAELVKAVGA